MHGTPVNLSLSSVLQHFQKIFKLQRNKKQSVRGCNFFLNNMRNSISRKSYFHWRGRGYATIPELPNETWPDVSNLLPL